MKKYILSLLFCFGLSLAIGQIDRSKQPEPGPAPEINLDEAEKFELNNGLTVLVVENHKLPRVRIQLNIDNPPILEGEKAGVQSLTGSLMGNGSKSVSKDDFNEEVDFLGATLNIGAQGAFAQCLTKYFPRILELMADASINPNFTQEEFEKEKAKLITGLKTQEKDVSAIANRVQDVLVYGKNHPKGEFITEESVNNVTLVDVQQFYRDYFVPANAYLIVVGDVEFDNVNDLVTAAFTPWTKAVPPSLSYSEPVQAQYSQINFVDVPNAVQSEISVQNLVDLKMKNDDYLDALLANRILGGGAQARLFLNLREDKGYTYGSYSGIGNDKYGPSTFRATASVRNAVTDSSVVEMLKEIDKIIKEPVSAKELANAKAKYVGNFVMALERPETVANYALNIETQGLSNDYYKTYLERLDAVTIEDVQNAANKYFTSSNSRVIVAGKGSEVLENLEKVEFNGKKVPVLYYDKYGAKAEKPNYDNAIPEGVSVNSILQKYLDAVSGDTDLSGVESIKMVFEGEAMGSKIKIEEIRTTDKYAKTTFMNDSPMMGVVAKGDELTMKQGPNKMPLPEAMKNDMQAVMGLFPEQNMMVSDKTKLAGIEKVGDKDAYKVEVPGEMIQTTFFYDVESGLKLKETSVINMNGQSQNSEVIYGEYNDFNGVLFPATKSETMGPGTLESKLIEVVLNIELSDADFD
ncbi:M16 family metallopeptidase [Croceivirga thetidis]|uniref:Insulinase family protein n=1 Tax=Croceivirga thetidis TaxID=2721623 RepID=A0ABX1GR40_9FLAO|nr:pitrilysin family protein [Croceivirga thetidis]NKI31525.1 insulinase family protein [Croceivirga thetidis]